MPYNPIIAALVPHLDVEQAERVEAPLEVEGDLVVEALRPPALLRPERHRDRLAERVQLQTDAPDRVQNTEAAALVGSYIGSQSPRYDQLEFSWSHLLMVISHLVNMLINLWTLYQGITAAARFKQMVRAAVLPNKILIFQQHLCIG